MRFAFEPLGQERSMRLLRQAVENGPSHAYLFLGPEGIGKRQSAVAFGQRLLNAATDRHPELMILERDGANIRIADIRRMQEWMAHKPFTGRWKIVILADADYLNAESANALLKTLEEPPPYGVIILVAHREALPPTIVSRCQVVRFQPLSPEMVEQVLIDGGTQPADAGLLAALSGGSPGRAQVFAGANPRQMIQRAAEMLLAFRMGDAFAAYEAAEYLEKEKEIRDVYLNVLEALIAEALRKASGISTGALLDDASAESLAAIGIEGLNAMAWQIADGRRALNTNANGLILFTNVFLRLQACAIG
ncbi:MAG: ATP-binding protein [Solirubrobacterales bacterium]